MVVLYGLKNCDTCRKARKWAEAEGLELSFKDLRADGLPEEALDRWIAQQGWETLLNRRGTTWRTLTEEDKQDVDTEKARRLMLEHPALIKRPVFDSGDAVMVGFTDTVKSALLA